MRNAVTSRSWIPPIAFALVGLTTSCAAPRAESPQVPLKASACWNSASCFEVLERSSDWRAAEHAAEAIGRLGPPAIPRLEWQIRYGDDVVRVRAAHALGHVAKTHPEAVRAAAGDMLRELCADSRWTPCWAAAKSQDRAAYPVLLRHLRQGNVEEITRDGSIPPVVAEWFVAELENRRASAAVHLGVLSLLEDADGPLSLATLERIRRLLAAERQSAFDRRPRGYPCRTHGKDRWSRGDYLVSAIGLWGVRGVPARAEVRAVWQSSAPVHASLARSTLAKMGDRSILPSIQRDLASESDLRPRALGDLALLGPAARSELPELILEMQRASGHERDALLSVILAIGGPLAVRIAWAELRTPPDDDHIALRGLEAAARDRETDLDQLRAERLFFEQLATESPFLRVRRQAQELLEALDFPVPEPVPPACPPVVGGEQPPRPGQPARQAKVAGATVVFRPFGDAPEKTGCTDDGHPAFRVGDECLRGRSHGEFGYEILVHDRASNRALGAVSDVRLNPVHFLHYADRLLVIESLAHIVGFGRIDRLERDAQGHWRAFPFADLPDAPEGYAFDESGALLLLIGNTSGECREENGGWQVVRIGKDGHTEALR